MQSEVASKLYQNLGSWHFYLKRIDTASRTPITAIKLIIFFHTQAHQVTLLILNNKIRYSSSVYAILSLGITGTVSRHLDVTIFSSSPHFLKHHFLPMPLHLSLIRIAHLVHWGHSIARKWCFPVSSNIAYRHNKNFCSKQPVIQFSS